MLADVVRTAGDITVTGITSAYADIGSEASQTVTTAGGKIQVHVNMCLFPTTNQTADQGTRINLRVDSTDYLITTVGSSDSITMNGSFSILVTGLSAGSHTFKVQVGYNGQGQVGVTGNSSQPFRFQIIELPL